MHRHYLVQPVGISSAFVSRVFAVDFSDIDVDAILIRCVKPKSEHTELYIAHCLYFRITITSATTEIGNRCFQIADL